MISVVFTAKILNGDIYSPNVLRLLNFNVPQFYFRNFDSLKYDLRIRTNYLKFEPINVLISSYNEYSKKN